MRVRACALFLSLSINNSRGRCVFYGSNRLNDGTKKNPQRETMVTFQACPDCPGVAYETVPFLVHCPCLRPGQISRDCTIILGLKLAKSNNDSACSQRFFSISQVLNPGLIQPVLCADNSLKEYKPHAKDSEKEVDIGEGEKGVVYSYL